jgi:hypothetical protein
MDLENDIYEVWKELCPNEAFSQGLKDCAGKLFVPTEENRENILEKINSLRLKTDDPVQKKFLTSIEATIKYREAPHDITDITWTLFDHLLKEGINTEHISSLLDYTNKILENSKRSYRMSELTVEIKAILVNKCNSLLGIIGVIAEETEDENLKKKIEDVSARVKEYKEDVGIKGLDKGDFSEIFPILEGSSESHLNRENTYSQLIKELFDYYETPEEIEKKALSWLENELPKLKETATKIADNYEIEMNIENIDKEIARRRDISKTELLGFIKRFRENAQKVVEQKIVRINPNYKTDILETPHYLLNFIPTAAMTMFDTLTDKPFNVFFVTTDEKRSPPTGAPDIFQLVVHEEYGHCVNFSNSAVGFAWKPSLVEQLNSSLHYPISEGISFHRELETLELLEELAEQPKEDLTKEERELLNALAPPDEIDMFLLESRFVVLKWRVIRFLRAIGDVRINMNKQTLTEFVEWASEKTGFSKKIIYDQIFIFLEMPGYAPCYSIAGMALKDLQEDAKRRGKDVLEFNTITSSLGFPPRTVFEERLRNL